MRACISSSSQLYVPSNGLISSFSIILRIDRSSPGFNPRSADATYSTLTMSLNHPGLCAGGVRWKRSISDARREEANIPYVQTITPSSEYSDASRSYTIGKVNQSETLIGGSITNIPVASIPNFGSEKEMLIFSIWSGAGSLLSESPVKIETNRNPFHSREARSILSTEEPSMAPRALIRLRI